ncbi:MAG: hypothetical protein ACREQ5_36690, partial [Candidatus Dormibacteria bacterium]
MIYLSGAVKPMYATWIPGTGRPCGMLAHARNHMAYDHWSDWGAGVGFMHQPRMGNLQLPGVWAADNGCFRNPDAFDLDRYRRWLSRRDPDNCLFVTAPDWVGEWCCTLERYYDVADVLRGDGWRVALVAQDGLELYLDHIDWATIDALFMGGSTPWKLSPAAALVVREARSHGLWCHMGRVNSRQRVRIAHDMGCDSVDGTYLAHTGAQGFADVIGWLE